MKWIIPALAAFALAVLSQSAPTTIVAGAAYASKMDGKPYGAHAKSRRAACFNGACRKKR